MLGRRLAEVEKEEVTEWAEKQGLSRYFGSSLKGEAGIDWDDKGQREQLLTEIVQDGRRLLSLAEEIQKQHPAQTEAIAAAAALLLRLIAQDVEEKPGGGFQVKSGTAKDRGPQCSRSGDAAWTQERQPALQRTQGSGGGGDGESVDHGGGGAGGQCWGSGESSGVGAAKRTSAGGEGRRNGGRLCLRRRPDAASLCRGRTNPDGQGAGQSQPQLFFQE
jgi:hypothetical protein